jgi:hypothetical protein
VLVAVFHGWLGDPPSSNACEAEGTTVSSMSLAAFAGRQHEVADVARAALIQRNTKIWQRPAGVDR